jgi:magnesium-transporting ATPase (P-type)
VITVNFIMDPPDGSEMNLPPISREDPLISKIMWQRMIVIVPTMILCTFGWFVMRLRSGIPLELARTETLTLLVLCEWFNVFNCRSENLSSLNLSILKNKWLLAGLILGNLLHLLVVFWRPLGSYFHTAALDPWIVPQLVLVASFVLIVEEIRKYWARISTSEEKKRTLN